MRIRKTNSFRWLFEPMEQASGFYERPMFGCQAAYLHGRLMAVVADREDPWNGLMVPTSREHHASLMAEFPELAPHPVLKKWLFIPSSHEDFESEASRLVEAMLEGDPRFGVEPKAKDREGKRK